MLLEFKNNNQVLVSEDQNESCTYELSEIQCAKVGGWLLTDPYTCPTDVIYKIPNYELFNLTIPSINHPEQQSDAILQIILEGMLKAPHSMLLMSAADWIELSYGLSQIDFNTLFKLIFVEGNRGSLVCIVLKGWLTDLFTVHAEGVYCKIHHDKHKGTPSFVHYCNGPEVSYLTNMLDDCHWYRKPSTELQCINTISMAGPIGCGKSTAIKKAGLQHMFNVHICDDDEKTMSLRPEGDSFNSLLSMITSASKSSPTLARNYTCMVETLFGRGVHTYKENDVNVNARGLWDVLFHFYPNTKNFVNRLRKSETTTTLMDSIAITHFKQDIKNFVPPFIQILFRPKLNNLNTPLTKESGDLHDCMSVREFLIYSLQLYERVKSRGNIHEAFLWKLHTYITHVAQYCFATLHLKIYENKHSRLHPFIIYELDDDINAGTQLGHVIEIIRQFRQQVDVNTLLSIIRLKKSSSLQTVIHSPPELQAMLVNCLSFMQQKRLDFTMGSKSLSTHLTLNKGTIGPDFVVFNANSIKQATPGSIGVDITNEQNILLQHPGNYFFDTGIQIVCGQTSFMLTERSSFYKTLVASIGPTATSQIKLVSGIIDSDYYSSILAQIIYTGNEEIVLKQGLLRMQLVPLSNERSVRPYVTTFDVNKTVGECKGLVPYLALANCLPIIPQKNQLGSEGFGSSGSSSIVGDRCPIADIQLRQPGATYWPSEIEDYISNFRLKLNMISVLMFNCKTVDKETYIRLETKFANAYKEAVFNKQKDINQTFDPKWLLEDITEAYAEFMRGCCTLLDLYTRLSIVAKQLAMELVEEIEDGIAVCIGFISGKMTHTQIQQKPININDLEEVTKVLGNHYTLLQEIRNFQSSHKMCLTKTQMEQIFPNDHSIWYMGTEGYNPSSGNGDNTRYNLALLYIAGKSPSLADKLSTFSSSHYKEHCPFTDFEIDPIDEDEDLDQLREIYFERIQNWLQQYTDI